VVSQLTMLAKGDERTAKACSVMPRTVQRIVSVWRGGGGALCVVFLLPRKPRVKKKTDRPGRVVTTVGCDVRF
jgi:hypothetical protein